MAEWRWDERTHRYHAPSGRFLSPTTDADLREQVISAYRQQMADLGQRFGSGDLSVTGFRAGMRELIEKTNGLEYMFGRGGRNAMTVNDRTALRQIVADEWRYLDQFARQASFGGLSQAQIEARARMYANAGHRSAEAGRAASYSGLTLPAFPGVGTDCRSNCRCSWDIKETEFAWTAYWRRHASDSCATCVSRESAYKPYTQPKGLRVVA